MQIKVFRLMYILCLYFKTQQLVNDVFNIVKISYIFIKKDIY